MRSTGAARGVPRGRQYIVVCAVALSACPTLAGKSAEASGPSTAAVLVSANDQRFILTDGVGRVGGTPRPGSLTFVKLGDVNAATHLQSIPVSVVGPPKSMDTTPDGLRLLVASSMRTDVASGGREQIPDNRVTVIDLAGEHPVATQTLTVGSQPSGLRVSPDGDFTLVANRAEGTVSRLRIRSGVVETGPATQVAPAEAGVSDVAISHDAKWMLATLTEGGAVVLADCDDGRLGNVQSPVGVGQKPYAIEFIPGTYEAVIADVSERGMLHYIEVDGGRVRLLDSIYVGIAAEGLAVSQDGRWIAVTCLENSMLPPEDPRRKEFGRLVLLHRDPANRTLRIEGTARTPRIPQAVEFITNDGTGIAVGCYENRVIAFYKRLEGRVVDTGRRVSIEGQPAALCVIKSE
jgi:DNA-binding beta-propeller fold protein YncE